MKATRISDRIVVRMMEDVYVELSREEAKGVVTNLIELHQDKVETCRQQVAKIMASINTMQSLLMQAQMMF